MQVTTMFCLNCLTNVVFRFIDDTPRGPRYVCVKCGRKQTKYLKGV